MKGKSSVPMSEYIADNTVKNLNLKCSTHASIVASLIFLRLYVYQLLAHRNTLHLALNNENKKSTQSCS